MSTNGLPTGVLSMPISRVTKFFNFKVDEYGCWVWGLHLNPRGYAYSWIGERNVRVHRAMWELTHGKEVPPHHVIHHLCNTPSCINPYHLQAVTQAENNASGNKSPYKKRKLARALSKLKEGQYDYEQQHLFRLRI